MIIYYNDTFDGATFIDECTVDLRNATSKNWSSLMGRKRENIDKHKHNIKLPRFNSINNILKVGESILWVDECW